MPQADSYADPISFGSILTFLRSCSFLSDKLRKPAIHFSGPIYKSPREVPSSRIRFSRGVVEFMPTVQNPKKKIIWSCPSFENKYLVYFFGPELRPIF